MEDLIGKDCIILKGKQKGRVCTVLHYTTPHPLSSEKRVQVFVQNPKTWLCNRYLLLNESSLRLKEQDRAPNSFDI